MFNYLWGDTFVIKSCYLWNANSHVSLEINCFINNSFTPPLQQGCCVCWWVGSLPYSAFNVADVLLPLIVHWANPETAWFSCWYLISTLLQFRVDCWKVFPNTFFSKPAEIKFIASVLKESILWKCCVQNVDLVDRFRTRIWLCCMQWQRIMLLITWIYFDYWFF